MAGAVVAKGTVTDKTSATSLTLPSVAIATGRTIYVVTFCDSVLDTLFVAGVTWNGIGMTSSVSGSDGFSGIQTWFLHNVTGATGDVVATFDGPLPASVMAVVEIAGCRLTAPVIDKSQLGQGSSASPTVSSGVTAQANEVLIGAVCTQGPLSDNAGAWTTFTDGQRDGTEGGAADSNRTISLGHRIVTATGNYASAKTGITSRVWNDAIQTFRCVTDVSITLGVATGTATAHAMTLTPGTATLELGAAVGVGVAEALGVSQSEQPALIIRNADAAGVAASSESSTAALDPWTGNPWSPPIAVYLKSGTNAGVRTTNPYLALIQNHDFGILGTTPSVPFDAFDAYEGVARYVGRNGSHSWELVVALGSLPIMREDPDEPHWLMSYFEFNGDDSEDLLCLGVTPSGRIICRIRGRLDTMSPINTLTPDGLFHSIFMTYDYNVPAFILYLDNAFVLRGAYGTAMTTENERYAALAAGEKIDFPGPRAGYHSRFMLLNGRLSDTRIDARISRAAVYSDVDPWFWDIPQGQPFTNVPTTGTDPDGSAGHIVGYDFSLDAKYYNPAPNPALYGGIPLVQPQFALFNGSYTPFVSRVPAQPAYTKLASPIP